VRTEAALCKACHLEALFWPKDLPQCLNLKCPGGALKQQTQVHGLRAGKAHFSLTHFREILRAKEALQDDK